MKRLALFVGINVYPQNPLNCARADAEVLYKEFSRHYDVVKLLVDKKATPDMIIDELDILQKQATAGDMLLFYFSGHGSDYNGERLLAVPDYDRHGTYTATVGLSTAIIRKRTDVRGLHRLFILDCCRTHYEEESDILDAAAASGKGTGYVRRHGKRSIVWPTLLSSSSPGQTSYEHSAAGHGYFTEALIKTLHEPSVRDFNHFRDHLDLVMSQQNIPCTQDPYFEGPLGADLPFWPTWDDASENANSVKLASSKKTLTAYIAVDMSETMRGLPLESVKLGIRQLSHNLGQYSSQCDLLLGVIGFNDKSVVLVEPTSPRQLTLPPMVASGCANIGKALTLLSDKNNRTASNRALLPLVFILSADGRATSGFQEGLTAFRQARWSSVVVCALGNGADISTLKRIGQNNVFKLKDLSPSTFLKIFNWIAQAIQLRRHEVDRICGQSKNLSQSRQSLTQES